MILEGLLYAESHEWIKVSGNQGYVGISDYAQHNMGDIVFIELPKVGSTIKKGDMFGAVESVKAASDLYLPISGKVLEINKILEISPERLNEDPYGNWIIKIEILDAKELETLLKSDQYKACCES